MGNLIAKFAICLAVSAFYTVFVVQAVKTGRARRFFGGWVTSAEAPGQYYSSIVIGAILGLFALYLTYRCGLVLFSK
jgi:hypothetical protein